MYFKDQLRAPPAAPPTYSYLAASVAIIFVVTRDIFIFLLFLLRHNCKDTVTKNMVSWD